MRIVRLKIIPAAEVLLADLSTRHGISDPGFTGDIFALLRLRGSGLPDPARRKKLAQRLSVTSKIPELHLSIIINKRAQLLKQLAALPYFLALSSGRSTLEATERLLLYLRRLYYKRRQSLCMTCALMAQCDFGKQYGGLVKDIRHVVDADFAKKVNPACPALPEIDYTQQISAAVVYLEQLHGPAGQQAVNTAKSIIPLGTPYAVKQATQDLPDIAPLQSALDELKRQVDPEEDSEEEPDAESDFVPLGSPGFARGSQYTGGHTGDHLVQITEAVIDKLTASHLALFELGRKLDSAMGSEAKGKFRPTEVLATKKDDATLSNMGELQRLQTAEHALPEKLRNARIVRKEARIRQDKEPETKKALLYLLIDNSGSMSTQLGQRSASGLQFISRGGLSTAFALAVSRRVQKDRGLLYVRFFTESPGHLLICRGDADFESVRNKMSLACYNGAGTDIMKALTAVQADILAAKDELAKAEVLLISDTADHFDKAAVQKAVAGIEFNILDVSGAAKGQPLSHVQQALKDCALKYYRVDSAEPDIEKLVKLL